MTDLSFSRLWGSNEIRATATYTPYPTDTFAMKARDIVYQRLKKEGKDVKRWTNPGQLRKYWSLGVDCGQICNVYKITVED